MKYTKTAAALALAGVVAAPSVYAVDLTLGGFVGINLDVTSETDAAGAETDSTAFSADDATISLAATHALNNGLTGYANYRTDFGLTSTSGVADNIYVGMKGDFGDIRVGEVPDATEYGQVAGDILTDVGGENAGLSYTGAFGSTTVGLTFSPEDNSDHLGFGVKFSAGGFGIGIGAGSFGDADRLSAGATFGVGGISAALAYKDLDNDSATIGLKGSYSAGDASAALTFEAGQGDANEDDSAVRLDLGYDLGDGFGTAIRVQSKEAGGVESTLARLQLSASF